ncbi:MAG: copper chaperone PCu(A)C [Acidimicrobiales bacterium]|nr:copper chaperone PCu(A)C [Acidimicrobiales bacterium]
MTLSSVGARPRVAAAGLAAAVAATAVVVLLAGRGGDHRAPALEVTSAQLTEGGEMAAAYVTVENRGGPDRLVGAATPAADRVTLHETVEEGGLLWMQEVDGLDVPAGGVLVLEPGVAHLMLEELPRPLRAGQQVPITLRFERSGPIAVEAAVVAGVPAGDGLSDGGDGG